MAYSVWMIGAVISKGMLAGFDGTMIFTFKRLLFELGRNVIVGINPLYTICDRKSMRSATTISSERRTKRDRNHEWVTAPRKPKLKAA